MQRTFPILLAVLLFSSIGWSKPKPASDASPKAAKVGEEKPSKSSFKDEGWGLKLSVPKGWELRRGTDGLLMTSDKDEGFVLVFHFDGTSVEDLRTGASEGLIIDGGNMLRVVGSPKDYGKTGIRARYQGIVGAKTKVVGYAIGVVSKHGTNAIVLAVGPESDTGEKYEGLVEKVAKSIKLTAPRGPKKIKSWKKELSNTELDVVVFARSSGFGEDGDGLAASESLILCADGSFLQRKGTKSVISTMAAGEDSSTAGMKNAQLGQWTLNEDAEPRLVLTFDDGTVRTEALAYSDKRLELSGHRYFWSRAKCK